MHFPDKSRKNGDYKISYSFAHLSRFLLGFQLELLVLLFPLNGFVLLIVSLLS